MKICNSLLQQCLAIDADQKITTHGFRRTGANILAFYQPNGSSWNLSLIRNYCGWTQLSECEMMNRYLIHCANHLEDESIEAYNPYKSHRNIVIKDSETEKTLDLVVQKSVTSALNQVIKLNNYDIKVLQQSREKQTTTNSIEQKMNHSFKSAKSSLLPSTRCSKKAKIHLHK